MATSSNPTVTQEAQAKLLAEAMEKLAAIKARPAYELSPLWPHFESIKRMVQDMKATHVEILGVLKHAGIEVTTPQLAKFIRDSLGRRRRRSANKAS